MEAIYLELDVQQTLRLIVKTGFIDRASYCK